MVLDFRQVPRTPDLVFVLVYRKQPQRAQVPNEEISEKNDA